VDSDILATPKSEMNGSPSSLKRMLAG